MIFFIYKHYFLDQLGN